MDLSTLTPTKIVGLLDKHVHGQESAKEALALAIRNRWRRLQLPEDIRENVKKQNILLKGPTGSGKTALLRAVQKELGWPIHFVDITQYTETGYKGKDLEEIISNFVEAYEDKPLPDWYKEELRKTPTPTKVVSGGVFLRDLTTEALAERLGRAVILGYSVAVGKFVDPEVNPLVDGDNRLYDSIETLYREQGVEPFADSYILYKLTEMKYPDVATVDVFTEEMIAYAKTFEGMHLREAVDDASLQILYSEIASLPEDIDAYQNALGNVLSRVCISPILEYYQSDYLESMLKEKASFTPWWLWGSAIYDDLIRSGAWREVSTPNNIHNKRLNAKARKRICEIYGFTGDSVVRCANLSDVFRLALSGRTLKGQEHSPLILSKTLMRNVATRRLRSKNWASKSPHLAAISTAVKPIVGADDSEAEVDEIRPHLNKLKKFLKEANSDYNPSRDPLVVWDDYLSLIEEKANELSRLNATSLGRFVGRRGPSKSFGQNTPWNVLDNFEEQMRQSLRAITGDMPSIAESSDVQKYIQDYGICFIDEIDKLGSNDGTSMVSRDGVQRGLLTLVEGAEYPIKSKDRFSERVEYTFDTSNLMFVAAGAFSVNPVESLIPELRGRFPVVAEIKPLTKENYVAILKLQTSQVFYISELLKVENVKVVVDEGGYEAMAEVCGLMNANTNLGARRLDSVIDRVFHEAMMSPDKFTATGFTVTKEYVYGLDWSNTDLVIKFDYGDDEKPVAEKAN